MVNDASENYTTGYIALFRSLRNHWIWEDPVKLKWWLDLLLEVNHKPKNVSIKYELIECGRGQSVKSLESWAKSWRTNKSTVIRFFKMLEKDKMICIENLKITTRITVCNYDSYNGERHDAGTAQKRRRYDTGTTPYPNNNVNNVNNDKNVYSTHTPVEKIEDEKFRNFVIWYIEKADKVNKLPDPITLENFNSLMSKYEKDFIAEVILDMNNHKDLNKKYVSAYRTLNSWIKIRLNGSKH